MKKIEINIPDGYYFDAKSMSVKKCPIQVFEFVDLGLPSGTLWATYNVGAKKILSKEIILHLKRHKNIIVLQKNK